MGILATLPRAESADRRYLLGASECAAVLGLHPTRTAFDVFAARAEPEQPTTVPMARGNYLEAGVREWVADILDVEAVEAGPKLAEPAFVRADWPGVAVRPDGAFRFKGDSTALYEGKTSAFADGWGEPGTDQIPREYLVQALVQLAVCDVTETSIVSRLRDLMHAPEVYEIRRRRDVEDALRDRLCEWTRLHLVEGKVPEIDGSDACRRHLYRAYPTLAAPARAATADEAAKIARLAEVNEAAKALDAEAALLKNELMAAAGESGALLADAWKCTIVNVGGRKLLDQERLKAEFPEAWEACQKQGAASRYPRLFARKEGK